MINYKCMFVEIIVKCTCRWEYPGFEKQITSIRLSKKSKNLSDNQIAGSGYSRNTIISQLLLDPQKRARPACTKCSEYAS